MREPVRVLVVDDDPLVRAALAMVLGGSGDCALVGEATDGDEVPAAVAEHVPDVVLMDIRMPRVDGLTATERLRSQPGGPEVIVLTTFDADASVLRALRAGASGFLLKDTPPAAIVDAVRRVAPTPGGPPPGCCWTGSATASARWPWPSVGGCRTPRSRPRPT